MQAHGRNSNNSLIAALSPMADAVPNSSYFRSLELLCKKQAALTMSEVTRSALLTMADEYGKQAELLERQSPGGAEPRD
jgi:hypothetical protein